MNLKGQTEKAIAQIKAAIEKASHLKPLEPVRVPVEKMALVLGGGITGIQAALDIASAGYHVTVVEKEPFIGGKMAQLKKPSLPSTVRPEY